MLCASLLPSEANEVAALHTKSTPMQSEESVSTPTKPRAQSHNNLDRSSIRYHPPKQNTKAIVRQQLIILQILVFKWCRKISCVAQIKTCTAFSSLIYSFNLDKQTRCSSILYNPVCWDSTLHISFNSHRQGDGKMLDNNEYKGSKSKCLWTNNQYKNTVKSTTKLDRVLGSTEVSTQKRMARLKAATDIRETKSKSLWKTRWDENPHSWSSASK